MSVKDVKIYFDKIVDDYHEMITAIKDMEEEVSNGLVEPERLENMKNIVNPLMLNYERWSYMMYLLNKPNRKSKEKRYEKTYKKVKNTFNDEHRENMEVVKNLKSY